ncbi:MAG: tRNA (adenosine(37)-N6)-threonylcarbamoyltransferase complex ATPase subunit type 1 TsaE [Patescibacteria group bacterium]|nr:tRNA (adenosine(37)-N6)-threonylcarbamoyltransferase complex ATPase subunit type 1 TsaE [Patescibacteria group bacterium]
MEYISKSEEETYKIASDLAKKIKPGDVFALEGDLGSGKTTFIKGFAKALGITNEITSPTFVLLKRYNIPHSIVGIKDLIHIDCYRMSSLEDAHSIGINELLEDKDSIILLEWPSKIREILPLRTIRLTFEYINDRERKISVDQKFMERK